ncbi:MAG: hypothetical protein J7M25_02040 [Deltaproteobacteria bacterium]|nr:hypothetical protein [Deltaproteobacteria bacterium]
MFEVSIALLAIASALIVLGVAGIPPWWGISAGLAAAIMGWFRMKRHHRTGDEQGAQEKDGNWRRTVTWSAMVLGMVASAAGIALYLVAWFWAAS